MAGSSAKTGAAKTGGASTSASASASGSTQRSSSSTANPNAKFLGGIAPKTTARTDADCSAITIVCELKDREDLKKNHKKSYQMLKSECEKGIAEKFDFHKYEELMEDKKDGLKSISSTIEKRNALFRHFLKNGMDNVFRSIPEEMIDDAGEWVPRSSKGMIDLETNHTDTTLDNVKKAVSWQNKRGPLYYVENNDWSETAILNSCEEGLKLKLIEDLEKLNYIERGGPTAFMIMMKYILSASEESMTGIIEQFKKMKLTDIPGENVRTASTIISNIHGILEANNALPSDFKSRVFKFFSHCTTKEFVTNVEQMKGYDRSNIKMYTVENILTEVVNDYSSKSGSGLWEAKITTKGQNSGFSANADGLMCFNCGELGHMIKDCPKPIDESAIAARKKIIYGDSNRRGKYDKKTSTKSNNDKDKKDDKGDKDSKSSCPKNPKRQPPKTGESHEKEIDGETLSWCGKCGRWGNHKTADHKTKEELQKAKENKTTEEQASGSFAGATALNF